MEPSHLPDAEFKTLVIRMVNDLRGRVDKLSQNFNKEIESIQMRQENNEEYTIENQEWSR